MLAILGFLWRVEAPLALVSRVLAAPVNRLLRRNPALHSHNKEFGLTVLACEYKFLVHAHIPLTLLLFAGAKGHDGENKVPCDYQWL